MIRQLTLAACLIMLAGCRAEQRDGGIEDSAGMASQVDAVQLPVDEQRQPPAELRNYIAAQIALAADDIAAAKAALEALANESDGTLRAQAETAATAADISAMRAAFRPLSESVMNAEIPEGYAVAFCPMRNGMAGAHWVQQRGTIANPYFGKSMLTCGEFKR